MTSEDRPSKLRALVRATPLCCLLSGGTLLLFAAYIWFCGGRFFLVSESGIRFPGVMVALLLILWITSIATAWLPDAEGKGSHWATAIGIATGTSSVLLMGALMSGPM